MTATDSKTAWFCCFNGSLFRTTCPSVKSVTPDYAKNQGLVKIEDLAGNGFCAGMEVRLVRDSREIRATSVEVRSPYRAGCVLNLAGVETGLWDVVVTNPNGLTGRLSDGFRVTDGRT